MAEERYDFSTVAHTYSEAAIVQQAASDRLFQLLRLKQGDRVIDVGCGSGALTRKIHELTGSPVTGIDISAGMIEEARVQGPAEGIEYLCLPAQKLDQSGLGPFDVVFCNSALHWIHPLPRAVRGFRSVLRAGGKVGIQAAAMSEYCPNFIRAMDRVKNDPRTREGFRNFVAPWSFLETEDAYVQLFTREGFRVAYVALEQVCTRHTVEEAFGVFSAGAAAGYLNKDNYRVDFDAGYMDNLMKVVRDSLAAQADRDGTLELRFNRIYLVAFA